MIPEIDNKDFYMIYYRYSYPRVTDEILEDCMAHDMTLNKTWFPTERDVLNVMSRLGIPDHLSVKEKIVYYQLFIRNK